MQLRQLPLAVVVIFVLSKPNLTLSQPNYLNSALIEARAGITICHQGVDAYFSNISGIHQVEQLSFSAGYKNYFGIGGLNSGYVLGAYGSHSFGVLLMAGSFGDNVYKNNHIGTGYAHKIGLFSLGLALNYHNEVSLEQPTDHNMHMTLGGQMELSSMWSLGIAVKGLPIVTAGYNKEIQLNSGIQFQPSPTLSLEVASFYNLNYSDPWDIGISVDHDLSKRLALRGAYKIKHTVFNAGFSINLQKLSFDYAIGWHTFLGTKNTVTLRTSL